MVTTVFWLKNPMTNGSSWLRKELFCACKEMPLHGMQWEDITSVVAVTSAVTEVTQDPLGGPCCPGPGVPGECRFQKFLYFRIFQILKIKSQEPSPR